MSRDDKCAISAPLLLLLKGHPGSGKSTLAKQIATTFHIAISDKDDSRDCFQAAEEQHGPAGGWDLNALSYEVMFRVASSQLACGQSVVIDCPLSKAALYSKVVAVAQQVNASSYRVSYVYSTCSLVCRSSQQFDPRVRACPYFVIASAQCRCCCDRVSTI